MIRRFLMAVAIGFLAMTTLIAPLPATAAGLDWFNQNQSQKQEDQVSQQDQSAHKSQFAQENQYSQADQFTQTKQSYQASEESDYSYSNSQPDQADGQKGGQYTGSQQEQQSL